MESQAAASHAAAANPPSSAVAFAASAQPLATPAAAAIPQSASTTPDSNRPPPTALSPIVSEVLKMAAADVATPVLKTYVECLPMVFQLTEADVIALKQNQVADEVVTLLLQRGAEIRAATFKARKDAAARTATAKPGPGGLDPESYEYFQHYYLHSRTLATVSQSFSPYGYSAFGPAYGYGPAFAYGAPYRSRAGYGWSPGFHPGWRR